MKHLGVMFGRALMLRYPLCGRGRLFRRWLFLADHCPGCGLWFEREEGYFTGAMGINLVVAELLFVGGFIGSVILAWPRVPWTLMYGWAPVAGLAPLAFSLEDALAAAKPGLAWAA